MGQVLNLYKHNPVSNEKYFVDTNVWYWTSYVSSKTILAKEYSNKYQLETYPQFIEKAINNGSTLCYSPLTLAELAHVIENAEHQLYMQQNVITIEKKVYRKITAQREKVLAEIEAAWAQVTAMATSIDTLINKKFVIDSIAVLKEGMLDAYDSFYIQLMRENQIDYLITDDYDFASLNKIMIVTANKNAITPR
jgi:predicted nucleic acid-binding protein